MGEREESVTVHRLKAARAEHDRAIKPARPPRRGRPPKQRPGVPAADEEAMTETRSAADEEVPAETRTETKPERATTRDVLPAVTKTDQQQQKPTYAQVMRHGRVVKPPERLVSTTTENRSDTTD